MASQLGLCGLLPFWLQREHSGWGKEMGEGSLQAVDWKDLGSLVTLALAAMSVVRLIGWSLVSKVFENLGIYPLRGGIWEGMGCMPVFVVGGV